MELAYAFLADAADTNDKTNRFFVFNGGVDAVAASSMPAVIPTLSIVAKIRVAVGQRSESGWIKIIAEAPDGSKWMDDAAYPFGPFDKLTSPIDRDAFQLLAINYRGLQMTQFGKHVFKICINENVVGTLHFYCDPIDADLRVETKESAQ